MTTPLPSPGNRMRPGALIIALAGAAAFSYSAAAQQEMPDPDEFEGTTVTTVRALDKVTARVSAVKLPQDEPVRFGTLAITARYCWSRPPEETPETFAFLEIVDLKDEQDDTEPETVFSGWMVASSPALNALEHPVYDIWVTDCKTISPDVSEGSE